MKGRRECECRVEQAIRSCDVHLRLLVCTYVTVSVLRQPTTTLSDSRRMGKASNDANHLRLVGALAGVGSGQFITFRLSPAYRLMINAIFLHFLSLGLTKVRDTPSDVEVRF